MCKGQDTVPAPAKRAVCSCDQRDSLSERMRARPVTAIAPTRVRDDVFASALTWADMAEFKAAVRFDAPKSSVPSNVNPILA